MTDYTVAIDVRKAFKLAGKQIVNHYHEFQVLKSADIVVNWRFKVPTGAKAVCFASHIDGDDITERINAWAFFTKDKSILDLISIQRITGKLAESITVTKIN